jgi:hypothetical protein
MMDEVQKALKSRYSHVHPLMFQRSLERAKTNGELFDLLESIPKTMPIVWNEQQSCWETTDNLLQAILKEKAN